MNVKNLRHAYFAFLLITGIMVCASGFRVSPVQAAGPARLYLAPGASTVGAGSNLVVSIRINTGGEAINSVQANLTYPADKFDFIGIAGGGAFPISAEAAGGGGGVRIARGTTGSVSGDQFVASVTFRAKASSGQASISFAGDSAAVRSSDNSDALGSTGGGTYTFSASSGAPPAGTSGGTPSKLIAAGPKDTTTPKIIEGPEITMRGASTVTITWRTDEDASSIVEFGLSNKYGLSTVADPYTKDHRITLSSPFLVPGITFHYRVKSADRAGNIALSGNATFHTAGYTVTITVRDETGQSVANTKLILAGQSHTTNSEGSVTIQDLAPGKHIVVVERSDSPAAIEVVESDLGKPQFAHVKVAGMRAANPGWWVVIGVIAIVFAASSALLGYRLRKNIASTFTPINKDTGLPQGK